MQPKKTSKEPLPFFKLSTWIIIIIIIISSCIAVVSMFMLVYPLAATPLFPPCQLSQGPASVSSCGLYALRLNSCTCLFTEYAERRRQVFAPQCTIGTSPLFDPRDGFQMRALSFSHHRVSPDLSAMASSILVVDPSDTASRKQKSNLRVAWRGSQRVNYLCMLCCM